MGEGYSYDNGAEFKAPRTTETTVNRVVVNLPWLKEPVVLPVAREEIDGTAVFTASAIETHPTLERISSKLNGHTKKAEKLLLQRAKEFISVGRFSEGYPIRHQDSGPTITGFQSGEQDPASRVRAFIILGEQTGRDPVFVRIARCMAIDDSKIFNVLESADYEKGLKTSKQSKNRR